MLQQVVKLVVSLLVALSISDCASVMQTEPRFGNYLHLLLGHETDQHVLSVEILQIQKVGDSEITYKPKPNNGFLWLRQGKYTVKIKCNARPADTGYVIAKPTTTPLAADASYTFDIEDDFYGLDCSVTEKGEVLAISGKVIMLD